MSGKPPATPAQQKGYLEQQIETLEKVMVKDPSVSAHLSVTG